MKMKINISELAAQLALSTGKQKEICESFIYLLFNTIVEGLMEDEPVRIKGFGTFRVVEVEARKSVNIATGEDYEIPAHRKVIFVPSKDFASSLNEPFEMFETVELAQGVSLKQLEEITDADSSDINDELLEEGFEESLSTQRFEDQSEEEDLDDEATSEAYLYNIAKEEEINLEEEKETQETPYATEILEDIIPPLSIETEEIPIETEQTEISLDPNEITYDFIDEFEEPEAEKELNISNEVETESSQETLPNENETNPVSENEHVEEINESDEKIPQPDTVVTHEVEPENINSRNRTEETIPPRFNETSSSKFGIGFFWGALCTVLVCGTVFLIGFYHGWYGSGWENSEKNKGYTTDAPTIIEQPEELADLTVEANEPGNNIDETAEKKESQDETKTPVSPVYDTVSTTRYLTTISREHYGNYHFWPYIYEENKAILGHPNRIKPGTKVVVPDLAKYGVDPNNKEDLAKAKKLEAEIYSKYQ